MDAFHQLEQPFVPDIFPFIMSQFVQKYIGKIAGALQGIRRKDNGRPQKAGEHRRSGIRADEQPGRTPDGKPGAGAFITGIDDR